MGPNEKRVFFLNINSIRKWRSIERHIKSLEWMNVHKEEMLKSSALTDKYEREVYHGPRN